MKPVIALFAKAPLPGRVKTRLQPELSGAEAAELHRAFVADTWQRLREALPEVDAYLYADMLYRPYGDLAQASRLRTQRGKNLGARMYNCFAELTREGYGRVIITGSDSPTLPPRYLVHGFKMLESADAVLGPTDDGGYYAAGCTRPHPEMFDGVAWSSDTALVDTEQAFRRAGLRFQRLESWYDVDTIHELKRLAKEPALPPKTAEWMQRLGGRFQED